MKITIFLVLITLLQVDGFLNYQNPRWPPTYQLNLSSISMACNSSGFYNVDLAASFGIVSFDWSNQKKAWSIDKPMSCESRLVSQAELVAQKSKDVKVFTYFNLVKALPWFESVRSKLEDPAYSGFFLQFKPGGSFPNGSYYVPNCDAVTGICSTFYHDQLQTPAVPSPTNPNPDGACVGFCDCGKNIPCGEYLFDHRNGSMLRTWLVDEILLGPTFLGNNAITGLFIDDFWCSDLINGTGACGDPVEGPSEIDAHSKEDMGLSDQDIADITNGWLQTMTYAQQRILSVNGFTWSLFDGQANANASPMMITKGASCTDTIRRACSSDTFQNMPFLFGLSTGSETNPLPFATQEIIAFQLMRGPYAYFGFGEWGMTWQTSPPLPFPAIIHEDFGEPTGPCTETIPGSSQIFVRSFTKANISLNCESYETTVQFK
jgi:hypothetical protein